MKKEEFTGEDLPPRLKREELAEALKAIAPEATVVKVEAINWTVVDPDTGEESIEREEERLIVTGLPKGLSREDVLGVLERHKPLEPDDEAKAKGETLEERVAALEERLAVLEGKK